MTTFRTKIFICFASVFVGLLLTNCGINDSYNKITKDFYFTCWDEHCKIVLSKDDNPSFFSGVIIEQSVFALGHNSDFIIAKQHPHKDKEIHDSLTKRIFSTKSYNWYYSLKNIRDTVFLTVGDSVFFEDGKWFHTKYNWTDPDSLKPYKKITNYYLIDIRRYDEGYKLYSYDNEKEFNKKRFILGVPDDLTFEFYDKTLE